MKGCIRTYTGRLFNVLRPKASQVDFRDMVHGLSNECRWAGQCRRFYSVLEHSIWVGKMAEEILAGAGIYGLTHDFHEAYCKDIPTPLAHCFTRLKTVKKRLDKAIFKHLGLPPPNAAQRRAVHAADAYAAWIESKMLFDSFRPAGREPPMKIRRATYVDYNSRKIMTPEQVRDTFELLYRGMKNDPKTN